MKKKKPRPALAVFFVCLLAALSLPAGAAEAPDGLRVGWAEADITPDEPVYLAGQFHARVSEGVMDPVTATALALESVRDRQSVGRVIMVSCDLVSISDDLRDAVRARAVELVPEIDPLSIFLAATHTHTAPMASGSRPRFSPEESGTPSETPRYGIELEAMSPAEYINFSAARIGDAVARAWLGRSPGGISFGLGQAVVAHNRLVVSHDGSSRMYGRLDTPEFSHIEGYEDHAIHFLFTYDRESNVTGMVVNLAGPAQVTEGAWKVSADFWHETRAEMRRRFGPDIFILAQHGPAGDQNVRPTVHARAERRMEMLSGRDRRAEIAFRLGETASTVEPAARREIEWDPLLAHRARITSLPRRIISQQDVEDAVRESGVHQATYERLLAEIGENPEIRSRPRWYTSISRAWGLSRRGQRVAERYELQQVQPEISVETHFVRLGDVALATNPFELYLDFGLRIQTRSPATQTFLIQLAGPGSYVPTERAVAGGGYGAVPASTDVGPEGGRLLVEKTLEGINAVWREAAASVTDIRALANIATRDQSTETRAAALERIAVLGTRLETGAWVFRKNPDRTGPAQTGHEPEIDGEPWPPWRELETPAHWNRTRLGDYLGWGWYRTTLGLPREITGKDLLLIFEGVDEQAWVFVNGAPAGEHTIESENLPIGRLWNRPFAIRVKADTLRPGIGNTLEVLVHASTGTGGVHGSVHAFLVSE